MDAFKGALGLTGTVAEGEPVRLTVGDLPQADGVVEFASLPTYAIAQTSDGIYAFMQGYQNTVVIEHHNFNPEGNHKQIEQAWQTWLAQEFG